MRRNVFLNEGDQEPQTKLTPVNSTTAAPLGLRGAVGAMRDSLAQLGADNGEAVIEIEPSLIDDSFVPDRMDGGQKQHEELVEAIRHQGQLVPVLLRPKPGNPDRYQVAYGHRRLRAMRELGKPVRAIVRPLDDDQLIIAQGQENNARKDLSFIEKAIFAMTLEDRGFDRQKTISPALLVDATELSRLISVARLIPQNLVAAIGPAPKVGRPRWLSFAELIKNHAALNSAEQMVSDPGFNAQDTDIRFLRIFAAAMAACEAKVAPKPKGDVCRAENWVHLATLSRSGSKISLTFDEQTAPKFAEFVRERLEGLYDQYRVTNPLAAPVMKAPKTATDG